MSIFDGTDQGTGILSGCSHDHDKKTARYEEELVPLCKLRLFIRKEN